MQELFHCEVEQAFLVLIYKDCYNRQSLKEVEIEKMKVIEKTKALVYDIRHHFAIYFQSILVLKFIQVSIALPLISYLFVQMLKVSGLSSITENNLFDVLSNPFALLVIFILGMIVVFFIYYEQAYYILLAYFHRRGESYHLKTLIKRLNRKAHFFLSLQSLAFILYFILILPLASIGLSAGIVDSLYIPHFIIEELFKFPGGLSLYVIGMLLVFYLSFRFLLVVPCFVVEEELSIMQGMKKSWFLTKKKTLKHLAYLSSILLGYTLVMAVVSFILFLPLSLIEFIFKIEVPVIAGLTLTLLQIVFFVSFGLLQVILADLLLGFAYPTLGISEKTDQEQANRFLLKKSPFLLLVGVAVFLFMVAGNIVSVTKALYQPTTQIIAHRGYTARGVENTIGALREAKAAKADYVEMDVLQTKDLEFVVLHDTNLSRLAKKNVNVHDLTLEELQAIEVSAGGFTDRIPSLKEYITVAKEIDIKLLIEIKHHGHESEDMEARFVQLLQKEGVTKEYIVQSLKESSIDEVKALDPEILTGFLVALNIGSLPKTTADFIVIEEFSLNQRIIDQAHAVGKGIGVWTVNQEPLMRKVLNYNVDGLVTDFPSDAYTLREEFAHQRTFVQRVQELIE